MNSLGTATFQETLLQALNIELALKVEQVNKVQQTYHQAFLTQTQTIENLKRELASAVDLAKNKVTEQRETIAALNNELQRAQETIRIQNARIQELVNQLFQTDPCSVVLKSP